MDLSIIIVNYNVADELKQCLTSVQKAVAGMNAEVFVVDNASEDESCRMIEEQFSWVRLIRNLENLGFAKANNQALRIVSGRYVLILNPDTVIEEQLCRKMVAFMDEHQDCGGLGAKMLDAEGNFLPESKRGFPTVWTAFCKLSGLGRLFPRSDFFNHYYLGALPHNQTNEIEILAGACMMLRKSVIDSVGLFDERYFLYGEDIDFSHRIVQAGYKNYYFPEVSLVHLKGRSTRKSDSRCVKAFYDAMSLFADTYLKNRKVALVMIKTGVAVLKYVALVKYFVRKSFLKKK